MPDSMPMLRSQVLNALRARVCAPVIISSSVFGCADTPEWTSLLMTAEFLSGSYSLIISTTAFTFCGFFEPTLIIMLSMNDSNVWLVSFAFFGK